MEARGRLNMTTLDQLLSLCRQYVSALDAKQYSSAQLSLTLLANVMRQMPAWMMPVAVEPAASVERELQCGSMYSLSNDDGNLVLVVRDHDGEVLAPVLSAGEAEQLRRDLSRVLMASKEAA